MSDNAARDEAPDVRLYLPDSVEWQPAVKRDSEKVYCYQKNHGEDFFHLISTGELYLTRDDEKLCFRCALRDGILTQDRMHWQNRARSSR